MLPKWFNDWNKDNPTNIFGPGIIIGVVGGAVFVAAMIVAWGQPFATASTQTGPRGTGMSVPEFKTALAAGDPTLEDYYTDDPIQPGAGEPLAKDIYDNVQVLGDLTEDNFNRVMNAMTQWVSPEQGCAYCHGDLPLEEYGQDNVYTKVVSRRMIQMTQVLNEEWEGHVNVSGNAGVNCSTCHRGQNVPSEIWFDNTPLPNTNMAGWGAVQNRASSTSGATSLPSDALARQLVDFGQITVHDLDSRVAGSPADEGVPSLQDTERTYALMNYFANSLGVGCVFCHNTRAFYDTAQVTPQWATASLGIQMVQELNNEYLIPLKDTYPEERLGHQGDAPKAACATCHKGYQKPYGGLNAIADWPELATTGVPEYQ